MIMYKPVIHVQCSWQKCCCERLIDWLVDWLIDLDLLSFVTENLWNTHSKSLMIRSKFIKRSPSLPFPALPFPYPFLPPPFPSLPLHLILEGLVSACFSSLNTMEGRLLDQSYELRIRYNSDHEPQQYRNANFS